DGVAGGPDAGGGGRGAAAADRRPPPDGAAGGDRRGGLRVLRPRGRAGASVRFRARAGPAPRAAGGRFMKRRSNWPDALLFTGCGLSLASLVAVGLAVWSLFTDDLVLGAVCCVLAILLPLLSTRLLRWWEILGKGNRAMLRGRYDEAEKHL